MKKILLSWIAPENDFDKATGEVSEIRSPNFLIHKHSYYNYDKHFIVSSEKEIEDDLKMLKLLQKLKATFKNHHIEAIFANLSNINNVEEIKQKVEKNVLPKLVDYSDHDIDIYIAAGTTSIRLVWFAIHVEWAEKFKTHLIQFATPKNGLYAKIENLKIVSIDLVLSNIPINSTFKQTYIDDPTKKQAFVNQNIRITKSITKVYQKAEKVAPTNARVLIYGETGAGKEYLAHFIHDHSERKTKPFIAINCGAFSENLLESQLFGYKKGAFTGASQDEKGFFEQANGGTLFMDEIGDISTKMQQDLLRILQTGKVRRLQDDKEHEIDVRIIAATNKDLLDLCKEGKFRWDLYFRLAVIELLLPPLRERGEEDLSQMLDFYLEKMAILYKRNKPLTLSPKARRKLLEYPYYGNVRELMNIVENLYVEHEAYREGGNMVDINEELFERMEKTRKIYEQIKHKEKKEETEEDPHLSEVEKAEKRLIREALERSNGKKMEAAEDIGWAYNTFKSKAQKYGLA